MKAWACRRSSVQHQHDFAVFAGADNADGPGRLSSSLKNRWPGVMIHHRAHRWAAAC